MNSVPNGTETSVEDRRGPATAGPLRWAAALVIAALPVPVVVATYLAWRERLPDPLPTHWGVGGQVDGITAFTPVFTGLWITAAVGALVTALAVAVRRWSWHARRAVALTGALVAGFGAGIWLMNVLVALDVTDAYQAPMPTWHLALMLGVAVLPPAGVFLVLGKAPASTAATGRPPADAPRLDLAAGELASWNEVMVPGGMVAVLAVVLVGATLLGVALGNPWATAPAAVVVLLVAVAFAIVRLTVDRRGLILRFGPWGWPQVTVPLHEIEYAEVAEVFPSRWGGWGYRMRPGGRALVLRRGPGVRLVLSGGRHFMTNARDPQAVAGLVNTMVDRVRGDAPAN